MSREVKVNCCLAAPTHTESVIEQADVIKKLLHQCSHCLTVYDEEVGEIESGIPVDTMFTALPDTYLCPLCEAPKKDFLSIEKELLGWQHLT